MSGQRCTRGAWLGLLALASAPPPARQRSSTQRCSERALQPARVSPAHRCWGGDALNLPQLATLKLGSGIWRLKELPAS